MQLQAKGNEKKDNNAHLLNICGGSLHYYTIWNLDFTLAGLYNNPLQGGENECLCKCTSRKVLHPDFALVQTCGT